MNPRYLDPPDLPQVMQRGEVARLWRGERTLEEILADASRSMDEEDRAADPRAWEQAHRRQPWTSRRARPRPTRHPFRWTLRIRQAWRRRRR